MSDLGLACHWLWVVFTYGERSCGSGLGLPAMPLRGLFFGAVRARLQYQSTSELCHTVFGMHRLISYYGGRIFWLLFGPGRPQTTLCHPHQDPGMTFRTLQNFQNTKIKINKNIGHVISLSLGLAMRSKHARKKQYSSSMRDVT